jgi:hypothetical protein
VNIRDERTVGEQVKSGFRLAGWVLLTLAFILVVLGSTNLLLGKGDYSQPIHRFLGACGLAATSTAMFATVRHWVKWFIGALGYLALKAVITLLLGSFAALPRLWLLEFALLLGLAVVLCVRYVSHAPDKIEGAGLVGMVVALSFTLVRDSNVPALLGVAVLTLIQLAHSRKRRTRELN